MAAKENNVSHLVVKHEEIPAFEEVRRHLLPMIKHDSWLKDAKDLLQQAKFTGETLFHRPFNHNCRAPISVTIVIYNGTYYQYVLSSYLSEWHISESTLVQIAEENLRKLYAEDADSLWQCTETGLHLIQGLDALTASVLLFPDIIEKLGIEQGDPVAIIPCTNMCIIGASQNVKQLCIMGEVLLKFATNVQLISTQPLRFSNKQWTVYEAIKSNDEHPFPTTPDEVKMLKRALKIQKKI